MARSAVAFWRKSDKDSRRLPAADLPPPSVVGGADLDWTIAPGDAGPQTFFASGTETDNFRGSTETSTFTNMDTGISAVPRHYSTSQILGFAAPPGVAIQIQVAFRARSSCYSSRSPWVALRSAGRIARSFRNEFLDVFA